MNSRKALAYDRREGFDYLRLEVDAGSFGHPVNYQGVSGGGIWLLTLTIDPDVGEGSLRFESIFCGVAFHQSEVKDNKRIITAHGPASVHEILIPKPKRQ
jgi:hypothetical protein